MLKIYNSLTQEKQDFEPKSPPRVGIYTCGPTVYDYVTIGNWRTYILGDILVRTLSYLGFEPEYVMNITDVGHLTGDNLGNADLGEDRMEKGARREGKSAWQVAEFYTRDFLDGFDRLNMRRPKKFSKATDHIAEQLELIRSIAEKGFAYPTSDGLYFDTQAYEEAGNEYGKLSTLDEIKEGARVKPNPEKKDPRDFALWKFSPKDRKRDMEWPFEVVFEGEKRDFTRASDSKFEAEVAKNSGGKWKVKGKGFPGWHIECSAMSMKYLGDQFDIHVGGEDLRSTHHPNEIAQSEAASGKKPFVKYWVHGAFLLVDGGRMAKSKGNAYSLHQVEEKGFDPMALRYFYLTGHYRSQQNFTWNSLQSAKVALDRLRKSVRSFRDSRERTAISEDKLKKVNEYERRFRGAVEDDLSMPQALGVVWEVVKTNIPNYDKYDLLLLFDQILGLGLSQVTEDYGDQYLKPSQLPENIQKMVEKRRQLRISGQYEKADRMRKEIKEEGYMVEDVPAGVRVKKIKISTD